MGAYDVQIIAVDNPVPAKRQRHSHSRDTLGGDVLGYCYTCHDPYVVKARTCRYCWGSFAPSRSTDTYCSKPCKARGAAWGAWIRETQREAAYGRRGPKAPRGGASLTESTERFTVAQMALSA